uniref:Store-operated calcium entry-associated regulatory factor n=1 Tax=Cryptococcus bacillisporus CA1280 TaxID=1296109 RepID=A0A0D0VHI1_CRYGA|nr:hypothetical protein I312_06516 [Cryptococcus bacillisporus CA1280]
MRRTNGGAKKIPLGGIKTLTFYADKYTAGRRTAPIPQLTCQGPGCKIFQPDVVQCTNMGDDGLGNVQWKCDTDLPSSLRLGKVDVSCEGWSAKGDPDILQGSCGLTYNLYKVNKGLEYGEDPYSTLPSRYIQRRVLRRHVHHCLQPPPRAFGSICGVEVARFMAARRWRWRGRMGWGRGWRMGWGWGKRTGRWWTRVWRRSSSSSSSLHQTPPNPNPTHLYTTTTNASSASGPRDVVEPRFLDRSRRRRTRCLAR